MQCQHRSVLYISFLLQIGVLLIYSTFQLSNSSKRILSFKGWRRNISELEAEFNRNTVFEDTYDGIKINITDSERNSSSTSQSGSELVLSTGVSIKVNCSSKGNVSVNSDVNHNATAKPERKGIHTESVPSDSAATTREGKYSSTFQSGRERVISTTASSITNNSSKVITSHISDIKDNITQDIVTKGLHNESVPSDFAVTTVDRNYSSTFQSDRKRVISTAASNISNNSSKVITSHISDIKDNITQDIVTKGLHNESVPSGSTVNNSFSLTPAMSTNKSSDGGMARDVKKSQPRFLVCPKPLGRLGNMMFEFAASLGIAHTLNYKYFIKPTHTLLKYFEIKHVLNITLANLFTINEGQWKKKKWRKGGSYLSHNLTISGYFQSWKYFHNVSKEVRNAFTIKPEFLNQAIKFLKNNTPEVKTLIGVHVRRGDFLSKTSIKEGRVVADRNYTIRSMDYLRKRHKDAFFVVLSDDQKWCRNNINGRDVVFSNFKDAVVDMAILSLCNHTIITSGSFGWWGGWLSGGTVIYLKDFPKSGSHLDKYMKPTEYYYPEWIGLSNGL